MPIALLRHMVVNMPWITSNFEEQVAQAKKRLRKEFPLDFKASISLTNKEEMTLRVLENLNEDGYSVEKIEILRKRFVPTIVGKYFKKENEILILSEEGENEDTIIHEYLHEIQICEPNREGIVDYITFKLTGNMNYIDQYTLDNWQELEKIHGFKKIKERLLSVGDCEEF